MTVTYTTRQGAESLAYGLAHRLTDLPCDTGWIGCYPVDMGLDRHLVGLTLDRVADTTTMRALFDTLLDMPAEWTIFAPDSNIGEGTLAGVSVMVSLYPEATS